MRFYFSFIFGIAGTIARIGEEQYYGRNIEDFGSYWYDDPVNKTNGEFDCVIKRTGDLYDFYECKFFDRPMTVQECEQEKNQLQKMQGIEVARTGFVCAGGFDFESKTEFILIDGEALYQ